MSGGGGPTPPCECCCDCSDLLEWLQDPECQDEIEEILKEIIKPGGGGGTMMLVYGAQNSFGSPASIPVENDGECPCGWGGWNGFNVISPTFVVEEVPHCCVDEFGNPIKPKTFSQVKR